jgi:hypothetical protein
MHRKNVGGAVADTARPGWRQAVPVWARQIARDGFARVAAGSLLGNDGLAGQWQEFRLLWDDLSPDQFLPNGQRSRLRRYGCMRVDQGAAGVSLEALPTTPFQQSADLMPLYGGQARAFAPIDAEVLASTTLRTIVSGDAILAREVTGKNRFLVGIHMIRVCADDGDCSVVTPEGIHRDGHNFIGMHLISRVACAGGDSVIHHPDNRVTRLCLTEPGESILLNDQQVWHQVEPIRGMGKTGHRDMLIIDFDAI